MSTNTKDFLEAAENGNTNRLTDLLCEGVVPNVTDDLEQTALIYAGMNGHTNGVRLLLTNGTDPNAKSIYGSTALMCARDNGYVDTVSILLTNGADPEVQDKNGQTALILAAEEGHDLLVKVLLHAHVKHLGRYSNVPRGEQRIRLVGNDMLRNKGNTGRDGKTGSMAGSSNPGAMLADTVGWRWMNLDK